MSKFRADLNDEQYVSITEAVKILRISRTPLYRLIKEKKIVAVKVGNAYRIQVEEIRRFIESGGEFEDGLYGNKN